MNHYTPKQRVTCPKATNSDAFFSDREALLYVDCLHCRSLKSFKKLQKQYDVTTRAGFVVLKLKEL